MYRHADTAYAHRPWDSGPERAVTETLQALTDPSAPLMVRPPIQALGLFPPRLGYGERTAAGMSSVLNLESAYPRPADAAAATSGGYSGTSFPALNVM